MIRNVFLVSILIVLNSCGSRQSLSNDINLSAYDCKLDAKASGTWIPIVTKSFKAPDSNEGLEVYVVDPASMDRSKVELSPAKCARVDSLNDNHFLTIEYLNQFRFAEKVSEAKESTQFLLQDFERVDLQIDCPSTTFLSTTSQKSIPLTRVGDKDIFVISAKLGETNFKLAGLGSPDISLVGWPKLELANGTYSIEVEVQSLVSLPKFAGQRKKKKICSFVIDNDPPSQNINGLESFTAIDGTELTVVPKGRSISILVEDESPIASSRYCLKPLEGGEKVCQEGQVIASPDSGKWLLEVTVRDEAGNESQPTSYQFVVYDQDSVESIKEHVERARMLMLAGYQRDANKSLLSGFKVYKNLNDEIARLESSFILKEASYDVGRKLNLKKEIGDLDAVAVGQNYSGDFLTISRNDFKTDFLDLASGKKVTINAAFTRFYPSESGNMMGARGPLKPAQIYDRQGNMVFEAPQGESVLDMVISKDESSVLLLRSRSQSIEYYPFDGGEKIDYAYPRFGFYTYMLPGRRSDFVGVVDGFNRDSILVFKKNDSQLWAEYKATYKIAKIVTDPFSNKSHLVTIDQSEVNPSIMEISYWDIESNSRDSDPIVTADLQYKFSGMTGIEGVEVNSLGHLAIYSKTELRVVFDRENGKSIFLPDQGIGEIQSIAFIDTDEVYVLYSNGNSIVWNTIESKVVRQNQESVVGVSLSAISGDGGQLVMGLPDDSLRILSTQPAIDYETFSAGNSRLNHLSELEGGHAIISLKDKNITKYLAESGTEATILDGTNTSSIVPLGNDKYAVSFADRGSVLLSKNGGSWVETPFDQGKPADFLVLVANKLVSVSKGRIDFWSLDGKWLAEERVNPFYELRSLFVHPQKDFFIISYSEFGAISGHIIVENGKITGGVDSYNVIDWVFFPDGSIAAVKDFENSLQMATGDVILELKDSVYKHRSSLSTFTIDDLGENYLSGGKDRVVKLWNGEELMAEFVGHQDTISGANFVKGASYLYSTTDQSGFLNLWDQGGKSRLSIQVPSISGSKHISHEYGRNGNSIFLKGSDGVSVYIELSIDRLHDKLCKFQKQFESDYCM